MSELDNIFALIEIVIVFIAVTPYQLVLIVLILVVLAGFRTSFNMFEIKL